MDTTVEVKNYRKRRLSEELINNEELRMNNEELKVRIELTIQYLTI
jgi:hypothetical protein